MNKQNKLSENDIDQALITRLNQSGTLIHFKTRPLILAHFPVEIAVKFLNRGEEEQFESHISILHKGQVGRDLFLICEGKISVWKDNVLLAELHKGDVFGELVLYRDHYRIANVQAEEPTRVLKFSRHIIMDHFARLDPKYLTIYNMNVIEILRRKLIATNARVVQLEKQLLNK
ncbi:MAG: cyclic nucleotide-binding domain-containing protein [Candidatus Marinimicrobia bacterium]|nr:cyclic nucleotide-binding domain-containing protein [Candidatus Neomarinimicrobiota bacterium]